jgi:DUF1365 family protein
MMYIDLAELDRIFQKRWFWQVDRPNFAYLRRRDHIGDPSNHIDSSVHYVIRQDTGLYPTGAIRMLIHLSHLGHCFNAVNLA